MQKRYLFLLFLIRCVYELHLIFCADSNLTSDFLKQLLIMAALEKGYKIVKAEIMRYKNRIVGVYGEHGILRFNSGIISVFA